MSKKSNLFILCVFLLGIIVLSSSGIYPDEIARAAAPPNSPYQGSGSDINVFDFARNESILFTDGVNGTSFDYLQGWYPTGYRGYRLHTDVSNLYRTENPLPNGDFENGLANWSLVENTGGIVKNISAVTGGNPGQCLDTVMKGTIVPAGSKARIENSFFYTSAIQADSLVLSFDIQFSADISQTEKLMIKVSVVYQAVEISSWSNTTDLYHPTTWDHHAFNTGPVNGSVTLRITIQRQGGGSANLKGHVYFDNFQYQIGTDSTPSEVDLRLNGKPISDAIAPSNAGYVDIYADPSKQIEATLANCWNTSRSFNFTSSLYADIQFDYEYYMYVKSDSDVNAQTTFSVHVNQAPEWKISYTVPAGRPPTGLSGYSFGLYFEIGWSLINVTNDLDQIITNYTYNPSTKFIKLNEDVVAVGKLFPIFASSSSYIQQIYPQKSANPGGPWSNVNPGQYFVENDYIRVVAQLNPIEASGNFANVSLFFPNRTLWQSDAAPVFDSGQDRLTSMVWSIPHIASEAAGSNWLITVSYTNGTQCGMRQQAFTIAIKTTGTRISPVQDQRVIWGQTVLVNATWQNQETSNYITDAYARIRYIDRNLQVRTVNMTPNYQGAYSVDFGTNLMSPDRTAEFFIEFYHYGYVNITGTQLTYTINLVDDINYNMIRPTQITGPDEYTAETTSDAGYISQVKFYDLYEAAFVRNDTGVWNEHVRVNYTRYHWTGTWVYYTEGSFTPNASNPTIFEKVDASYSGVSQVKYVVEMRIEAASWDFQQQNFTIIIKIVQIATDLDATRTLIAYPPTGDGWSQYNNNTDTYEAHLYWNEAFNVSVFYHFAENNTGIPGATVQILIDSQLFTLAELSGGYYSYQLDSVSVGLGITDLYVNASYPSYATQTIQIRIIVETRKTQLTDDVLGSVIDLPYDDDFIVNFTFSDTVTGSLTPIVDATQLVTGYPSGKYTIKNNLDGTYTITFWGNITETTYYVTIGFSRTNYTSRSAYFEITVRPMHTTAFGWAESVSVPWGTNVTIHLTYNDTDHNYVPITSANIAFVSTNGFFNSSKDILGVDYWIFTNPDGSYTLILSTWKVNTGLQPFTLIVRLTKNHYDQYQVFVSFQVRDNLTVLQRLALDPGTTIPWGDYLTITLSYLNLDNGSSPISGATLDCTWDPFYWSYSYNETLQAYILVIRTESRNEGSYTLTITARKGHYQTFTIIENFVVRKIQTNLIVDPNFVSNHPIGFNITFQIDYYDLDHGGQIPFSQVSTDWNETYYTIFYYGNGTYSLILNTTCRGIGTHSINITVWREHFALRTAFISLTLIPIPLFVEVLSTSPVTTEYNSTAQVIVTVQVTDLYARLINDSTTTYHWAGGSGTMNFIGAGVYNISFFADADTGAYVVTIQATKTNYQLGIGFIILNILPTDTILSPITPSIEVVVGQSYEISINFTTIYGTGIADANVTYLWAFNRTGTLSFVGGTIYNSTLDSTGLVAGNYIVYVIAGGQNVVERRTTINVALTLIATKLQAFPTIQQVEYGYDFPLLVYFNDTTNNLPITGATVSYIWVTLTGSLQPTGTPGWYNTTLPTAYPIGTYEITLTADHEGYKYALTSVSVIISAQSTTMDLVLVQTYYAQQDIVNNLTGITWRVPRGEFLIMYFSFRNITGGILTTALGTYEWDYGFGLLEFVDDLYVATLDLTVASPGTYTLQIAFTLQNYETKYSPPYELIIERVPTAIQIITEPIYIQTGVSWNLIVYYNDTYHNLPIIGGNLTITIIELTIDKEYMVDNGNGFYSFPVPPALLEGSLHIEITALGGLQYQTISEHLIIVVTLHAMVRNSIQVGLYVAVIGIILVIIWQAYVRVLSIPWLVRKMRKMSGSIRKGKAPKLSKGDIGRIGSRPELMNHILEPAYETINIPVPVAGIPLALDYAEREAEDEAIWAELKKLPRLEYGQKLELFQEMKRIPPTERVWFLEDLKRQMADGTRFARKVKEPEVSEDLEKELQKRLAAFPALSGAEKERIAQQLRHLPQEEWEEIFQTLATSDKPDVITEEDLAPDELPSLSEEERQQLLEDLKGLTEEERRKVLRTFREKHAEDVPKGQVVKGKKKFRIDKTDETEETE